LSSFKEYVLIDQDHLQVLSRFRIKPNTWVENEVTEMEQAIVFPSLDVKLEVKQIYIGVEFM